MTKFKTKLLLGNKPVEIDIQCVGKCDNCAAWDTNVYPLTEW